MNGAFAKVFCNLRPSVVRAKGLLVDILLENIPKYVRIDLIVQSAGGVVEIP